MDFLPKDGGILLELGIVGSIFEGHDGERLIRSGEEYRDASQGHINLLGINKVIEPISTGGLGTPKVSETYPPFRDYRMDANDMIL